MLNQWNRLRDMVEEKDSVIKDLSNRVKELERETKEHRDQIKLNTESVSDHNKKLGTY
jgi:predicted  nucleic acid-binding Zn-ribbon protein